MEAGSYKALSELPSHDSLYPHNTMISMRSHPFGTHARQLPQRICFVSKPRFHFPSVLRAASRVTKLASFVPSQAPLPPNGPQPATLHAFSLRRTFDELRASAVSLPRLSYILICILLHVGVLTCRDHRQRWCGATPSTCFWLEVHIILQTLR